MKGRRLAGQAYRLLVLLALAHAGRPLSKGELAWEVRANHPTITRVLREAAEEGLVDVRAREGGGYSVGITEQGRRFGKEHRPVLGALFGPAVAEHFRFGKRPAWLP